MTAITFRVYGTPRPGGSKKGFYIPKLKRVVITDAGGAKTATWRDAVASFASREFKGELLAGALKLDVTFIMPRPKKHFRTGARSSELRADAPSIHTTAPDTTKMLRSTEDALTGVVWKDDCLIWDQHARKLYGDKPGAVITITQTCDPAISETPGDELFSAWRAGPRQIAGAGA